MPIRGAARQPAAPNLLGTPLAPVACMARFLVVDDDPPTVHAMAWLLRDDGHEVSRFTRGSHAVDALAREPFDVVVADLDMPDVDGAEVARAARRHAPDACVVVVTGCADEQSLHGTCACMVHEKPVVYDALVTAVLACRARGEPCSVKARAAAAR